MVNDEPYRVSTEVLFAGNDVKTHLPTPFLYTWLFVIPRQCFPYHPTNESANKEDYL